MALIFGIDLGTTNSLIAVMEESRPRVIADPESGDSLLPSVVALMPGGKVEVGKKAIALEPHLSRTRRQNQSRRPGRGRERSRGAVDQTLYGVGRR